MAEADGRARLVILGGFLGSGKTTWLRHQLHAGAMGRALVVVNEAAAVPVDDRLLHRSGLMRVLAGGCACCEALGELVAVLRAACDARLRGAAEFDRIVLETSGLADPTPIAEAMRSDPVLSHHIVVSQIVVAVDALHGLGYLRAEALGRAQVECADRLIVTKLDAAEPAALTRLLAVLAVLNPAAEIDGSVMGSAAELPDFAGVAPEALGQAGQSEPIRAAVVTLGKGADWTAFALWLSALLHARGDDILRVKGVVRTPAGRLLLQSVRRAVQAPEILPDSAADAADDNRIVFLGRNFRPADIVRSLKHYAGIDASL